MSRHTHHPRTRIEYNCNNSDSGHRGAEPFICIIQMPKCEPGDLGRRLTNQLVKEVANIFSYKRFGVQEQIKNFHFADHKLTGVSFAIDWAETGLDHMKIGTEQPIKLEMKIDGTYDYQTSPALIAGKTELASDMELAGGLIHLAE